MDDHHLPVEEDLTGIQLQTAAEGVEEGRLAAPTGAHDGQDLSGSDEAIDVLENLSIASSDGDAPEGQVDRERALISDEAGKVYCCCLYPGKGNSILRSSPLE